MAGSLSFQLLGDLLAEAQQVKEVVDAVNAELEASMNWPVGLEPEQERVDAGSEKLLAGPEINAHHYYPFLFIDAFPQISIASVRQLAIAGYLYERYLLAQDRLLDNQVGVQDPQRCRTFLLASAFHEEALIRLQALFASGSPFWSYLRTYRQEFIRAVFLETVKHTGRFSACPAAEGRQLARGKSAIAKASTTALALLANTEEMIAPLADSQDWVAAGFQLYDDLQDWKKDYAHERYSYLLNRVIVEGKFSDDIAAGMRPDLKVIGQVLYYSGLAEELLAEGNRAYEEALRSVEELPCPRWTRYIQLLQANNRKLRAELEEIRTRTLAVYQKPAGPRDVSLSSAIERTIWFLATHQSPEGCWGDFRTLAGVSTGWVTGYVGSALRQGSQNGQILAQARQWLVDTQLPEGGWGYHEGVPMDADSTGWGLQLLAGFSDEAASLSRAVEALKLHQNPIDGGFRTYHTSGPVREYMGLGETADLSGWCASHLCVTAVAIQALLRSGVSRESEEIRAALDYLRRQQNALGYWEAYWWDGRLYGTCQSVQALNKAGAAADESHCRLAMQWLLHQQLDDGSWSRDGKGQTTGQPFPTALAVQALLELPDEAGRAAAARGVQWLLQEQVEDGSWCSYPILRMSRPWSHAPWTEAHVEVATENMGTGILVRDHQRLFTSATILNALLAYQAVTELRG